MALQTQTGPRVLSPDSIIELATARRKSFSGRDEAYETYLRYYRGKQSNKTPSVMASNSQGRPLMRVVGETATQERAYTSQRLSPIVDDSQALLGRMPASRVEPPDMSEAGLTRAEKLTKFLISTHELSQMDRQQAEMGFHLPCLGDGCYLLEVDPDLRRVVWTVVDPSTAYPAFMWGYRRFDLWDLIVYYRIDAYEAAARWGYMQADDEWVPVTIYTSQRQRTVVVGNERPEAVHHVIWDLDFCPAVWVFNKINGAFAQSDIAQSLVQQDALDFLWAVRLDGAVHNTYPMIGVRNPANVQQDSIVVGPGAPPIALQQDGDIIVRNTQGDISAINQMANEIEQEIWSATGTSQARQQGQLHSSIQTGRAIHASQGPQATRVELKQVELGAAIQRVNSMTLELQEKGTYGEGKLGDKELEIFGRYRGQAFRETLKPKEDIDGWYRNRIFWEPVTGLNLQQKVAVAYEGKAAQIWDSQRAMEIVGEDDPQGMLGRVENEKLREAHLQAQIQGMLGGQGQSPDGNAGPGGAGGDAAPQAPGPAGGSPAQQPPSMVARPRGMMQPPLATGVPKGVTRQAVESALQLVADKLKGTVALIGEVAQVGVGSKIQALISDHRDYSRVLPVLQALDPKAVVRQMAESKWPQDAVRVV